MLILSIAGIILIIVGIITRIYDRERTEEDNKPRSAKDNMAEVIAGIALIVLGNSISIVPTGYTGVRSTFGQIDSAVVPAGFNWKIPFVQSIEKVNNKQQDITFEDKVWSETANRTELYFADTTVTYTINPDKSAWIYANVSDYTNSLVSNSLVASGLKASSKALDDEDATNRAIIEPAAQEAIQTALDSKYGPDVVYVNKVTINDSNFSDSYNEAIAQKNQSAIQAQQQAIENQKAIDKAKADAEVATTQAQADADAEVIRAQGAADANKLLNDSLTEQVLENQKIDKWDGKLPTYMGNGDMSLLIQPEQ